jgi:hypothetical protein
LLHLFTITEGSLEVKLPTIWKDGKAEVGRVREEQKERRSETRKSDKKKMQVREKVEKSRFTAFFRMNLWLRRVEK